MCCYGFIGKKAPVKAFLYPLPGCRVKTECNTLLIYDQVLQPYD